jgi:predicted RNA-binding protein with PIN domain
MPYFFDGNNLIGLSAERARGDRQTRRAFLELLSGYSSSRGGKFIAYFDGDDPDRAVPPKGVRVRYSAPLPSDDAIVRDIEGTRLPDEIIVVTNDRSLTSRCRHAGAQGMNWSGFIRRMEKRARPSLRRPKKEEQIDVKDWSKFFGLDPDSLE